jgi:hypothetical protein
MHVAKRTVIVLVAFLLLLFAAAFWIRQPSSRPLGKARVLEFPSTLSREEKIGLLNGDFQMIRKAGDLPPAVRATFTENGGNRLVLADPGGKFNPSDVIWDSSVPQQRLLFAGIANERSFVHIEQGGRGHTYLIEVFEVRRGFEARPLWFGYCREPAKNLEELRSETASGGCS